MLRMTTWPGVCQCWFSSGSCCRRFLQRRADVRASCGVAGVQPISQQPREGATNLADVERPPASRANCASALHMLRVALLAMATNAATEAAGGACDGPAATDGGSAPVPPQTTSDVSRETSEARWRVRHAMLMRAADVRDGIAAALGTARRAQEKGRGKPW